MNLWKVYGILLEYSCKSEYKLLVARVSDQAKAEKEAIMEQMNTKLQGEVDEKKQLKMNMQTMQFKME